MTQLGVSQTCFNAFFGRPRFPVGGHSGVFLEKLSNSRFCKAFKRRFSLSQIPQKKVNEVLDMADSIWYAFGPVHKRRRVSGRASARRSQQIMMNQMKLKQTAILVMGLLPLGVIAQTNKPQIQLQPPNFAAPGAAGQKPPAPAPEMPEKGKLSYAIGMFFGKNITNSIEHGELVVDTNTVLAAISDVVHGAPTKLTEAELTSVMNQLKAAMQPRMAAQREAQRKKMEEETAASKAKGDAFLAQFAKSPGVKTLPDGLEYKIIKEGTGPIAKDTDTVTVNYRGTLIDGTEFDHHDGFTTPVKGRIIPGWQKILAVMNVGTKLQVAIPSALGYGPRGSPPKIPGNSTLVFDMELTSITPGPPAPPPGAPSATSKPTAASSGTPVVSGEIIKVPSADELKKGAQIEVIKSGQTNVANTK
jgi:FKBP-type peptidyl-prolyl cis-trans isomerase